MLATRALRQAAKGARVLNQVFRDKIMSAEEAAALIPPGVNVGMSGFTGSGYPKAVPGALAERIRGINAKAAAPGGNPKDKFQIGVWTGASTAPELDGALGEVDGISMRLPFNTDPIVRKRINAGEINYSDIHLSHVAQHAWFGFLGKMSWAVIEVTGVTRDGLLIPSTSIGNNMTWLNLADNIIIEVNNRNPELLDGMHDVYYGTRLPPHRRPIMLTKCDDRIGDKYFKVDPTKVVAVVETAAQDRDNKFSAPDADAKKIAGHIIDFLEHERARGRLPHNLLPLQSGVGNQANAVLAGLKDGPFNDLVAYTEVMQDGMLELIKCGKLAFASATATSFSRAGLNEFERGLSDIYRDRVLFRTQEISNHPEIVRRLGIIAMNAIIEADIYGNVNSTHVMGTQMMNGIGGSGDFARNAYMSIFVTSSVAKGGSISRIVPFCSHVDHTEHDVSIIVTEQGLADLRGLSPRQRAKVLIEQCAHPDFKPELRRYFDKAMATSAGRHTPHVLDEALSWHSRYLKEGVMPGGKKPAAGAGGKDE